MIFIRLLLLLTCMYSTPVLACTAYAAGKLATSDGSVFVSHSDDGMGASDSRISFVPAADHPKGSLRPIWPGTETYPRYVGDARGKTYAPLPGQELTAPIGHIPQAAHTHGYFEHNYAIQNECQLSFGESTASAVFRADPVGTDGGAALLCVDELTKIAAERACGAREAVVLMGSLAEEYGFYGPDGGAGEVLMVGDPDEAWVFHILSDPSGTGALWAAQRVADDEVAVVANMFSIREIDLNDTESFVGSSNLHSTALAYRLWDGTGRLDFTRAFSLGEYSNKYYSGRRVWDGFRRFKPSLALPTVYDSLKDDVASPRNPWGASLYPFAVKPDELLSVGNALAAHRSHYEGTLYDTSVGAAAGPFGTPDRYAELGVAGDPGVGAWERTVSIYRTDVTWVVQAQPPASPSERAAAGTIWLGPADSSKTVFVPLMVAMGEPPVQYTRGNQASLDRGSAFWAHRYVQNLVQIRYAEMIVDVEAHYLKWEQKGAALVAALRSDGADAAAIKSALDAHADAVLAATWQLSDDLMVKFADGGRTVAQPDGTPAAVDLGYSASWLAQAGFADGPVRLGPPAVTENPALPTSSVSRQQQPQQPQQQLPQQQPQQQLPQPQLLPVRPPLLLAVAAEDHGSAAPSSAALPVALAVAAAATAMLAVGAMRSQRVVKPKDAEYVAFEA